MDADNSKARWTLRLRELCRELQADVPPPNRDEIRGEVWTILNLALRRYTTCHMARLRRLTREEIQDLASEKSLDLLGKIEAGEWRNENRTGPEIAGFLSSVARNGIIDHLRGAEYRHRDGGSDLDDPAARPVGISASTESPDARAERTEFVRALHDCTETLAPRNRRIWFFRVFYGLATKEIAGHPEITLEPAHVDVLLHRIRRAVGECMERKGHMASQLPPGSFVEIWKSFSERAKLKGMEIDGHAFDPSV